MFGGGRKMKKEQFLSAQATLQSRQKFIGRPAKLDSRPPTGARHIADAAFFAARRGPS